MEDITKLSQSDLQMFYFDILKSKYLQIKSMLIKQKDIYTCYKTINSTNSTSIDKCQELIDQHLHYINLNIENIEDMKRTRKQELLQGTKKEISKTNSQHC